MTAIFVQNFNCGVQRNNTNVGTTASAAAVLNTNPNFQDVKIINTGTAGAQVAFGNASVVAVNTAAAGTTNQIYIPAGGSATYALTPLSSFNNSTIYYSAITDSGTASLILLVGAGRG